MDNQPNFNSGENNYYQHSPEQNNQGFSRESTPAGESAGAPNYYQKAQPNPAFQGQPQLGGYQAGGYQNNAHQGMGQPHPQPQPYYNNAYSQGNYPPAGNPYSGYRQAPEEISVLQYLGMMWVGLIPFVGLIMMLVWAFSNDSINRRNYARAILINGIITLVLLILSWGFLVTLMYQILNNSQYYYY